MCLKEIGTIAGAGIGTLAGNPALGAKIGGSVGGALEGGGKGGRGRDFTGLMQPFDFNADLPTRRQEDATDIGANMVDPLELAREFRERLYGDIDGS